MTYNSYRLGDVTINHDRIRVPLSSMERAKRKGQYRYYGAQGIIDYIDDYLFDGNYMLIAEDGENLKSNKQNIAQIVSGQFWVNNHAHIIQTNEKCNLIYLCYLLNSMDISGYITGSAQPKLSQANLNAIAVLLPPRMIQDRVVSILASLDNKIELNNRINENLLQQAGAVFDKFYADSSNQQLFTSLINVLGGGTPKTGNPDFWNGAIPFFTPKDVGAPYTFRTEKYLTESGLAHCNSRLYPKNTTFVTARGTVGKASLAGVPMAMNQSCYALTSETADPLLVYFYVLKAVASLKHKASGAVFDAIVTRDFDSETINILSDDDSRSVLSVIRPMMQIIHNNSEENNRLASVRDSLLPRLMSGELDVSDLDL
ncbi:MAG: restriction endonuclease subunit S [Oscillospiraceae bacterium]|nr:restriction endonuclease subunit S [Oscillospiraceae bacterium]